VFLRTFSHLFCVGGTKSKHTVTKRIVSFVVVLAVGTPRPCWQSRSTDPRRSRAGSRA
jgi:hypothetical protein